MAKAVKSASVRDLKRAFVRGADVGQVTSSGSLLLEAVKSGDLKVIAALIDLGAPLDALSKQGDRPLSQALRAKRLDIVKTLIDAGSSVNPVANEPASPLQVAIEAGFQVGVEALLMASADPTRAGTGNINALDAAAQLKDRTWENLLLGRSAVAGTRSEPWILFKIYVVNSADCSGVRIGFAYGKTPDVTLCQVATDVPGTKCFKYWVRLNLSGNTTRTFSIKNLKGESACAIGGKKDPWYQRIAGDLSSVKEIDASTSAWMYQDIVRGWDGDNGGNQTARIFGSVKDVLGNPLAGIPVEFGLGHGDGRTTYLIGIGSTTSGPDGQFNFDSVRYRMLPDETKSPVKEKFYLTVGRELKYLDSASIDLSLGDAGGGKSRDFVLRNNRMLSFAYTLSKSGNFVGTEQVRTGVITTLQGSNEKLQKAIGIPGLQGEISHFCLDEAGKSSDLEINWWQDKPDPSIYGNAWGSSHVAEVIGVGYVPATVDVSKLKLGGPLEVNLGSTYAIRNSSGSYALLRFTGSHDLTKDEVDNSSRLAALAASMTKYQPEELLSWNSISWGTSLDQLKATLAEKKTPFTESKIDGMPTITYQVSSSEISLIFDDRNSFFWGSESSDLGNLSMSTWAELHSILLVAGSKYNYLGERSLGTVGKVPISVRLYEKPNVWTAALTNSTGEAGVFTVYTWLKSEHNPTLDALVAKFGR